MPTKKNLFNSIFLSICLLVSSVLSYGQSFGLERKFLNQITLPDSIYKNLLRDKDISDTIEESKDSYTTTKALKKQFFQTTRVNLNNDKLPDLIIKAQSRLAGANITRYWIFERAGKGYVLVFKLEAFGISLLKNRSRGYRNIKGYSISSTQIFTTYFRFDGKKYVESWRKIEDR